MITDWQKKKVAVLGFGLEGLTSAKFLKNNGADVWILDRKQKENLDHKMITEAEQFGAQFILGKNYLDNLIDFDIIIRSPGVRRLLPEIVAAEKQGVIITSQTKLFFDLCPCPIIGVTGTKGKGTTSTLVAAILSAAGKKVWLAGN